jgi:hypothetical protein
MNDAASAAAVRTPWHVWVVGVLTLLWNAVGALDYVMTQTRNQPYLKEFTPEQLDYFFGFPAWVVACWAIGVWGGVLGSLLLLLRQRLAMPVFVVSFVAMVCTTIYNFVLSNGMEMMGGPGALILSAVIFLIALALVFYSRALRAKGVLV